jgi:hypothetical protein
VEDFEEDLSLRSGSKCIKDQSASKKSLKDTSDLDGLKLQSD